MRSKTRTIASLGLMLLASMIVFADDAPSANTTVSPACTDDDGVATEVGPGPFLELVDQVQLLRMELLELRLERYDERIESLERELEQASTETSRIEASRDATYQEFDETDDLLGDPELGQAERAYLETTREVLDSDRMRALDEAADSLEERENALEARRRTMEKSRKRLIAKLAALRSTD